MIPCRLTGKPFWQLYLYQDPPPWTAYIECVKYFGYDSLMDGYVPIVLESDIAPNALEWIEVIVDEGEDRIVTQRYAQVNGKRRWWPEVDVYRKWDPPARDVKPEYIGLPPEPKQWQPVEGVREWPKGEALLKLAKEMMGDHGLVGVDCGTSRIIRDEQALYDYYDNPSVFHERAEKLLEYYERRFHALMALETKPDFICTGGSGTLIMQTPQMVRDLTLPIVKRMTMLAKEGGIFSHVHACGPEAELVRMCAEETDLTVIDPLEQPPMGDCILKDIKQRYGHKLVLKGNLHTTSTMLRGSTEDVIRAAKKAIADAAEGGRFILSTGDQCGRDTPDDNLRAMIETAREYGRYR